MIHDRTVAVKIRRIRSEADSRAVLDEARTLLTIPPHPNLAVAREDFFEDGRYMLVLDWIPGPSLTELLRQGPMSLEQALPLVTGAASALDHLHGLDPPVVHGDVTPSNIVCAPGGAGVLIDLGISSRSDPAGTEGFVAPEIPAGSPATPASDVYGLAATIHALLSGEAPRAGLQPKYPRVTDTSAVARAIARGLAFDPEARPASAGALVASLTSDAQVPNNIPAPGSSFVGRDGEMHAIAEAFSRSRIVTLTGPGGIGKTGLALAFARSILAGAPDAVWLAELDGEDDATIAAALSSACGAPPSSDAETALIEHLAARRFTIVLDNCEHVADVCGRLVTRVLRACRGVRVLATSRRPLGVEGEVVIAVPPLALEPADGGPSVAASLFVERARDAGRDLAADEAVESLCAAVEGIPLGIEIAAAIARDMPLTAVAAHIHDASPSPAAPERHRSLRAAVESSIALLTEEQARTLARMSVFVGGASLEAATRVTGAEATTVASLAASSLLAFRAAPEARYRMLAPVARVAAELLASSGEQEQTRLEHLRWARALVRDADEGSHGPEQASWLVRIESETGNIRAALATAIETEPGSAADMCGRLLRFWRVRGHLEEGLRWTRAAAESLGHEATAVRARALHDLAILLLHAGRLDEAEDHLRETASIREALGDDRGRAAALVNLGAIAGQRGDLATAASLLGEALALNEAGAGNGVLNNLGMVALHRSDPATARAYFAKALEASRSAGDPYHEASLLGNLGLTEIHAGAHDAARAYLEEAASIQRQIGDLEGLARTMLNLSRRHQLAGDAAAAEAACLEARDAAREKADRHLLSESYAMLGSIALRRGDLDLATRRLRDAVALASGLQRKGPLAAALVEMAKLEVALGRDVRAATLFGCFESVDETPGALDPADREEISRHRDQVRAREAQAFDEAFARGMGMSEAEAVAFATE